MASTYGTFVKGGQTRTAHTPAEAVQLRFDGWQERRESPRRSAPAADAPDSKPTTSKS